MIRKDKDFKRIETENFPLFILQQIAQTNDLSEGIIIY